MISPTSKKPVESPHRTSFMLAELARLGSGETLTIATILARFHSRAYGLLLILLLLPAFIPLPIGAGAISGPLVAIVGLQMALGLRYPWLPQRMMQRKIQRDTLRQLSQRLGRLLGGLERIARPRLGRMMQNRWVHSASGLQLLLLGILLALPIPFTNYPFALLILFYIIAIIEQDGVLLLSAWFFGIASIVATALLSNQLVTWAGKLLEAVSA